MPKRILQGRVTSTKCAKTVVVEVVRTFKHPLYKKTMQKSKKYHAHDEKGLYNVGDMISIIESRPYSKTKTFEVIYNNK
jgi:small subunit ribosomal protein S17